MLLGKSLLNQSDCKGIVRMPKFSNQERSLTVFKVVFHLGSSCIPYDHEARSVGKGQKGSLTPPRRLHGEPVGCVYPPPLRRQYTSETADLQQWDCFQRRWFASCQWPAVSATSPAKAS